MYIYILDFGGIMEIQINNQTIDAEYNKDSKVSQIVDAISDELKASKQVICQILIDDVLIPEEREAEAFERPVSEVKTLSLMVDTIDSLIMNSLKSLVNLIPELTRVINNASNAFRSGDTQKGKVLFSSSLEGLEVVPTILDGIRSTLKLDFTSIKHENSTLKDLEENMLTIIKSIFDVQNTNDFVSLSDLLEYELIPNLSLWYDAIPQLEKICQERISC